VATVEAPEEAGLSHDGPICSICPNSRRCQFPRSPRSRRHGCSRGNRMRKQELIFKVLRLRKPKKATHLFRVSWELSGRVGFLRAPETTTLRGPMTFTSRHRRFASSTCALGTPSVVRFAHQRKRGLFRGSLKSSDHFESPDQALRRSSFDNLTPSIRTRCSRWSRSR